MNANATLVIYMSSVADMAGSLMAEVCRNNVSVEQLMMSNPK